MATFEEAVQELYSLEEEFRRAKLAAMEEQTRAQWLDQERKRIDKATAEIAAEARRMEEEIVLAEDKIDMLEKMTESQRQAAGRDAEVETSLRVMLEKERARGKREAEMWRSKLDARRKQADEHEATLREIPGYAEWQKRREKQAKVEALREDVEAMKRKLAERQRAKKKRQEELEAKKNRKVAERNARVEEMKQRKELLVRDLEWRRELKRNKERLLQEERRSAATPAPAAATIQDQEMEEAREGGQIQQMPPPPLPLPPPQPIRPSPVKTPRPPAAAAPVAPPPPAVGGLALDAGSTRLALPSLRLQNPSPLSLNLKRPAPAAKQLSAPIKRSSVPGPPLFSSRFGLSAVGQTRPQTPTEQPPPSNDPAAVGSDDETRPSPVARAVAEAEVQPQHPPAQEHQAANRQAPPEKEPAGATNRLVTPVKAPRLVSSRVETAEGVVTPCQSPIAKTSAPAVAPPPIAPDLCPPAAGASQNSQGSSSVYLTPQPHQQTPQVMTSTPASQSDRLQRTLTGADESAESITRKEFFSELPQAKPRREGGGGGDATAEAGATRELHQAGSAGSFEFDFGKKPGGGSGGEAFAFGNLFGGTQTQGGDGAGTADGEGGDDDDAPFNFFLGGAFSGGDPGKKDGADKGGGFGGFNF